MSTRNANEIAQWNGEAGEAWVREADRLDRMMAEVAAAVLAAAGARDGERVIDIGCGAGTTTLALADAVGPTGQVTGVDISRPLLELARSRVGERRHVKLIEADASIHGFPKGAADLLFSKFGVMFFDDPETAFTNLRRALTDGGRLAFACWRRMADNPFATVPLGVLLRHVPAPPPADPLAPGPFAFADADRVCGLLERAGFEGAMAAELDVDMVLGETAEDAAQFSRSVGPASRLLKGQDEAVKDRAMADIAAAWRAHEGPRGVVVPARCWIVTARA